MWCYDEQSGSEKKNDESLDLRPFLNIETQTLCYTCAPRNYQKLKTVRQRRSTAFIKMTNQSGQSMNVLEMLLSPVEIGDRREISTGHYWQMEREK